MIWSKRKISIMPPTHSGSNVRKKYQFKNVLTNINTIVQIIAIILAGVWACWTFYEDHIAIPNAAPVNISIDLQLKKIIQPKIETKNIGGNALLALGMDVVAFNPSPKTVHLLPSAWIATGGHAKAIKSGESGISFENDNNNFVNRYCKELEPIQKLGLIKLNNGKGEFVQTEAETQLGSSPVAFGSLTDDQYLNPAEKISRKLVFYVPNGKYDFVKVEVRIPSVEKTDTCEIEWRMDSTGNLYMAYSRVSLVKGYRPWWAFWRHVNKIKVITPLNDKKDKTSLIDEVQCQVCSTVSTVSLWQ